MMFSRQRHPDLAELYDQLSDADKKTVVSHARSIREILRMDHHNVSVESYAIARVGKHYGLEIDVLCSKSQNPKVSHTRHIAMYVCVKGLGCYHTETGKALGGRHHSTIMHGVDKIGKMMDKDARFEHHVAKLIEVTRQHVSAHCPLPHPSPTEQQDMTAIADAIGQL